MALDLQQNFRSRAAAAVVAGLTLLSVATPFASASAQSAKVYNTSTGTEATYTGKPVTFHIGPGYTEDQVKIATLMAAAIQQNDRCPVTVLHDGFIPNSVDVEVDGETTNFIDIYSAGAHAAAECEYKG